MLFSTCARFEKRREADLCLIPFWKKPSGAKLAATLNGVEGSLKAALETGDFTGKEGELVLVYASKEKEKRYLLLGLGEEEKLSVEALRRAFGEASRFCQKKGLSKINAVIPTLSKLHHLSGDEAIQGIAEGFLLSNYRFHVKEKPEDKSKLLKSVELVGAAPSALDKLEEYEKIAAHIYFARDLINGNADLITPSFLSRAAKNLASTYSALKLTLLDKAKIEKEGLGLLAAVGRGASEGPYLAVLNYQGNPRSKDRTVFIGKGVTFDTGGINLKPTGSIETMRDDMSGAAAVLAIMSSLAELKWKINVAAVLPICENAIDARSMKPGDVYKSYSGKTVEINNTDAEGRLILADAITYAHSHLAPSRIIDFATLTGAIVIALGESVSGLFSNDDNLAEELMEASEKSGELLWRMPLFSSYKEDLKSDIADIRNSGSRPGSSIKAALFLEEFIGKTPWAHIDIAGTAFASKEKGYLPKNGIGYGVRLALAFLNILRSK